MSDTISDMLRTAAKAMRDAVETERIEPRVYRDLGQTVSAIAETFEAEASARDMVDTVEYDPAVTTTTLDEALEEELAKMPEPSFTAEQFVPAAEFSIPEGTEVAAWLDAWQQGILRSVGEAPLAATEITRYALEQYRAAVVARTVQQIAAQVSAVGIKADGRAVEFLPDFVQLRDHIAASIPKLPL